MSKQELLRKYLDDECSKEEKHLLFEYLREKEIQGFEDVIYKIWKELDKHPIQPLDGETIERINRRVKSKIA